MRSLRILLVEDNPGDAQLIVEAFKECGMPHTIDRVDDGQKAVDFLSRTGEYLQAHVPQLVLLDWNLPKKDGRQVLMAIKNDPKVRKIPVIVMTSSAREEDILQAYDNHANCYIRKPVDLDDFLKLVKKVEEFWFSVVELPSVQQ